MVGYHIKPSLGNGFVVTVVLNSMIMILMIVLCCFIRKESTQGFIRVSSMLSKQAVGDIDRAIHRLDYNYNVPLEKVYDRVYHDVLHKSPFDCFCNNGFCIDNLN